MTDFPLLTQPYHTYVLLSERLQASVAPSSPPQFTAFITTMVRKCFAKDIHMLLTILLIGYTGSIRKNENSKDKSESLFLSVFKDFSSVECNMHSNLYNNSVLHP